MKGDSIQDGNPDFYDSQVGMYLLIPCNIKMSTEKKVPGIDNYD